MCNQATEPGAGYHRTRPCGNCPYRTDAPLQHWSAQEFIDLAAADADELGKVYGCHKKDGHTCIGWLMDQDKRDMPSIALRVSLRRHQVTVPYLDSLTCPVPLFPSIAAMCHANYPDLFPAPTPKSNAKHTLIRTRTQR